MSTTVGYTFTFSLDHKKLKADLSPPLFMLTSLDPLNGNKETSSFSKAFVAQPDDISAKKRGACGRCPQ